MTVDSGGGGGVGSSGGNSGADLQWYFSQVKGTTDEEINEADIISTVEFNEDGELLATGDKGGRIVIFQREQPSKAQLQQQQLAYNSTNAFYRSEYNVYSTFQSHEAEFDYLKSLEIEEKINKIKWLRRKNAAHFLLSTNDKTVKLWKIRERNKRSFLPTESVSSHVSSTSIYSSASMFNGGSGDSNASANSLCVRDELNGYIRSVNLPVVKYMDRTEVEAVPKRVFANAHTYHINSISLNSDQETFMSADDLRINLWHIEITNQSFNIVDIKPANMEELAEVITAAEFHPKECNLFAYSSSRGTIRLCDMRQSALCDTQAKLFEEREDPSNKNFFSEIISSISDLKFSHSGRYLCTRDYLYVKVWDLNMENRPVEVYPVHDYLRSKLCILYENDCIFDKFECNWSPNDEHLLSGSYNNFFKSFNRSSKQDQMYECSREQIRPRQQLRPKRVVPSANTNGLAGVGGTNGSSSPSLNAKRNNGNTMLNGGAKGPMNTNGFGFNSKDEVSLESLDLTKKILHTSWHPKDNIIAIAATNNLYLYYAKEAGCSPNHQTLYSNTSSFMNSSTTTSSSSTTGSFNCVNPSGALNANNNTNNTNNINNSFANANRVPGADPSCLSLNTSFYTPSTNNGTNSSTSLLTSTSSSTTNTTSTSNSSTTIPINGSSTSATVVVAAVNPNTTSSNITTPATPTPLPLTTTNSMSL